MPKNRANPQFVPVAADERQFLLLEQNEVEIFEYSPSPDGSVPPTQVHILLKAIGDFTFVVRLKSREGFDNFIGALNDSADKVWPRDS